MKIIKEYLAVYEGDCIAFDIRENGGGDFLNPMLIELPNTHIVFRMDACKTDKIGSKPDIAVTGDALQFFLNMEKFWLFCTKCG